ncbi:MAG: GNAT family N-acetyltransferase [Armatimonadota bacterium]
MTIDDIRTVAIAWMTAAGWNPGIHDAETFFTADPNGFLVGELDGRPIACVSAVRYDDHFGFFGGCIVDEAFWGKGYGMALHEAGRRHLDGCTQGGDGVLENVELYKQIGRYAYRNARYQGVKPADWQGADGTVDARDVPFSAIQALDRACVPASRDAFLNAWIHQPDASALAIPTDATDTLAGYGCVRNCFDGWKIGPLFATSPEAADTLFRSLIARIPAADNFVLDVPEPNVEALALVRRYGMAEVFASARMYTGPFPDINLKWIYGVTTFELG